MIMANVKEEGSNRANENLFKRKDYSRTNFMLTVGEELSEEF